MSKQIAALLHQLETDPVNSKDLDHACHSIDALTPCELQQFVHRVRKLVTIHGDHSWKNKIAPVLTALLQWGHDHHDQVPADDEALVDEIVGFYRDLASFGGPRHHLLTFLTTLGKATALAAMAGEFAADPPQQAAVVLLPLVPLFRRRDRQTLAVFPALLEALKYPHAAAGILDLANFVTREEIADRHPAELRFEQLVSLLEGVIHGLERLEKHRPESLAQYRETHAQIQQATPLVISLCDALGLIGDERAIPHLKHVMELRHRRLQVEAAAALTRLGDAEGRQRLVELAAEATVRLRTLQYAGELEIEDQVDQQYRDPVAIAEAEFVTYLADPSQYGFPPTSCELVDSRTLYWPGYEEPRMCYLFRFHYRMAQGDQNTSLSNIGIAGPLTHVLRASLSHLSPDRVYAAFAGWQAEHSSIYEVAAGDWNLKQEHVAEDFLQRMDAAGYQEMQPLLLGYVFQRLVLVVRARREGEDALANEEGTAIVDDREIHWYGIGDPQRPIGSEEAYWIDKGQQLLDSFN